MTGNLVGNSRRQRCDKNGTSTSAVISILFGGGCSSARARVCARVAVGEFGEVEGAI